MKTILVILGTRPEAIKLAPVILELRHNSAFEVLICNTEQQKELSNQTLDYFGVKSDFSLNAMSPNQTLAGAQVRILNALENIYRDVQINATIIQGDTMSAFCGALVSFYNKIPIFHIEAGLRSYDNFEPYPEEALRQMIARIADLHFVPTQKAYTALIQENITKEKIFITGNTVVDTLKCLSSDTMKKAEEHLKSLHIELNDKLVFITVHRRENFGSRLEHILSAIIQLTQDFKSHQFVFSVHPNPNVYNRVVERLGGGLPNVILTNSLDYPETIYLIKSAKLILTDSGGIQEEAPAFGTPVLVMRYETERIEGIEAGFSRLVGADEYEILKEARNILRESRDKTRLEGIKNPYGDGKASLRISLAIRNFGGVK